MWENFINMIHRMECNFIYVQDIFVFCHKFLEIILIFYRIKTEIVINNKI